MFAAWTCAPAEVVDAPKTKLVTAWLLSSVAETMQVVPGSAVDEWNAKQDLRS